MEDHVRKLIEEKAMEIRRFLDAEGYIHFYRIIDYGVNFILWYAGGEHTLTLFYSPKRRRWTHRSVNEWVQNVVIPQILPLLYETRSVSPKRITLPTEKASIAGGKDHYFAEAREYLKILEPFAGENIDFSIICDYARQGVQSILKDFAHSQLDRASLQRLLEQPSQPDFYKAKEYLLQCLTQCSIPTEI